MGPLLLTAAYVGAAGSSGIPRVAWLLAREELGRAQSPRGLPPTPLRERGRKKSKCPSVYNDQSLHRAKGIFEAK
jgi:hypothetical protein